MTKRPSPFDTSIFRQTKVHLNNYENDLNALKSIEERTLKKLMDGSKKSHSIILNNKDYSNTASDFNQKCNNFMQKCVTDYFTVNGKKINENENDRVLISCLDVIKKCSFCDSITNTIQQCIKCLEFYCPACSFVVYEALEDKRICLSCS